MSLNSKPFRKGISDAVALFVTVIPFAFVIGLAIVESGMSPLVGWSTSPIIFGGAAQLTLITFLGTGTAVAAVITAALVIQARHLMYSAAMAPTFQQQPRWFRWLAPYALIDQVFALTIFRAKDDPADFRSYYIGSMIVYITGWSSMTALGLVVGPLIPEAWNFGFAIPLMFVSLVVLGVNRWTKAFAAAVAGSVAYLCSGLPNRYGLLIGAVAGVAGGYLMSRRSARE